MSTSIKYYKDNIITWRTDDIMFEKIKKAHKKSDIKTRSGFIRDIVERYINEQEEENL